MEGPRRAGRAGPGGAGRGEAVARRRQPGLPRVLRLAVAWRERRPCNYAMPPHHRQGPGWPRQRRALRVQPRAAPAPHRHCTRPHPADYQRLVEDAEASDGEEGSSDGEEGADGGAGGGRGRAKRQKPHAEASPSGGGGGAAEARQRLREVNVSGALGVDGGRGGWGGGVASTAARQHG